VEVEVSDQQTPETAAKWADRRQHDQTVWGFMEADVFVALPKGPMLAEGLGPPPFDVTLPNGSVRHVIVMTDGRLTPDDT
jgi:hypothetical protein